LLHLNLASGLSSRPGQSGDKPNNREIERERERKEKRKRKKRNRKREKERRGKKGMRREKTKR